MRKVIFTAFLAGLLVVAGAGSASACTPDQCIGQVMNAVESAKDLASEQLDAAQNLALNTVIGVYGTLLETAEDELGTTFYALATTCGQLQNCQGTLNLLDQKFVEAYELGYEQAYDATVILVGPTTAESFWRTLLKCAASWGTGGAIAGASAGPGGMAFGYLGGTIGCLLWELF